MDIMILGAPVNTFSGTALWRSLLLSLCALMLFVFSVGTAGAQTQRLDITEGQVAPIPVAIAEFTGLDGLPSEVGRQISKLITDALVR